MDFSTICRTCLSTNSLNPIFLNPDDHRRYATAVFITTGIKVEIDDGLPQKMCTTCVNYLNESLKFRKKCRETEIHLLRLKELNASKSTHESNTYKLKRGMPLSNYIEVEVEEDDPNCDVKEEITNLDEDDKPLKSFLETESDNDTSEIPVDDKQDTDEGKNTIEELINCSYEDGEKPKRVTCKLCQKNLSVRSIDSHMARRHPGADDRRAKCELCDNYVLKEKMNRHKILMHGTGCFRCGYCKSEFDSKEILVEHVSTCTAKKKKRKVSDSSRELHECDICHKIMQKASLRMHKAIKHAGLGPVCEHCGKRFGNKFRLNEHYRAKHGYEKFKCSYCDFQSAGVMAMRNHERRHRGEKPFVCEACGAKFHAAYLLAQHRQSHRTEKLVKCNLCPASFKANNSLHMHRITCHGSSLFKCSLCSRAYSCRHYAVKHLRHVHHFRGPVPPLQRLAAAPKTVPVDDEHV